MKPFDWWGPFGQRPDRPDYPPDVGPKYPRWMVTVGVLAFCISFFVALYYGAVSAWRFAASFIHERLH